MKVKSLVFAIVLVFTTVSCKKEKLADDTAILIGNWNWTKTHKVSNYCSADSLWDYSVVDSAYSGNDYSMEFFEKGKMKYYANGNIIWNNRIVFESKEKINNGPYQLKFAIKINNKSSDLMKGMVGSDSLLLYDFPKDTETQCEENFNYFVRG